jgi:hypothetical protein
MASADEPAMVTLPLHHGCAAVHSMTSPFISFSTMNCSRPNGVASSFLSFSILDLLT